VAVLGLVITPPSGAALPLPKTGGQQEGLAGVGLLGITVGFGLLIAGRQRKRSHAHRLQR
jgi:LPXTG-motif cell wall-anchored protein